ncbi:MAG: carbohydrate-binding family 9-like protein, partial [Caldilineaceae bacterium]|nr:carbohydrate-binding family 9-like protein [Caldilineaceae bacterium]
MRTLKILSFSIMVLPSVAVADFVPQEFAASFANSPPTIDGKLDDPAWTKAELIDQFYVYQSGGTPAASPGKMRILWDAMNLYVGMELSDTNILPSSVTKGIHGHDQALYEGDVIELFIRESRSSPKYFEFEWSPTGDVFDARFDQVRFGPPGTNFESGVVSAVSVNGTLDNTQDIDTGWTVEAKIPLSAFAPIASGSSWDFTFARYDYSLRPPSGYRADLMMTTLGDPAATNGGVTQGFHTYEIYDRLTFLPVPEPSALQFLPLLLLWRGNAVLRLGQPW